MVQTDDSLWHGIAETCTEKYGLTPSMHSMRSKWPVLACDCQLWYDCYKQVLMENRAENAQKGDLQKLTHAIYQSRRRREKESNPGIGISFKFIEDAEFLSSIPKYDEFDGNGAVVIDRTVR